MSRGGAICQTWHPIQTQTGHWQSTDGHHRRTEQTKTEIAIDHRPLQTPKKLCRFFQKFEYLLISINKTNNKSIMTGDFNCDYSHVKNDGSVRSSVQSIASVFNFEQHVKEPTRITSNSKIIIALTFSNFRRGNCICCESLFCCSKHLFH